MAKSLEDVLGYVPLTGVIVAIKTGIPDLLPREFYTVRKKVIGVVGRYTVVKGTRQVARLVQYGSPAQKRELKGLDIKDIRLMHTYEHIQLDPLILQNLRAYDSYKQDMGKEEVDRQLMLMRQRFDNLRIAAVMSMLANGAIYFDSDGNMLPSSSGSNMTIDYGIPANNKNQLNGIITSSWANANTNIPAQIEALKVRSRQLTGYELTHAFYGSNITTYLTQNNYVEAYLSREPMMRNKFLTTSQLPAGLFGLDWYPVYSGFYEDNDGTNQAFFGADTVTFTPDITPDVYEMFEGSYEVPRSFAIASDARAALEALDTVFGMFSYAAPTINPPTVEMFMGDTQLPVWKVVNAMFIGDTTP